MIIILVRNNIKIKIFLNLFIEIFRLGVFRDIYYIVLVFDFWYPAWYLFGILRGIAVFGILWDIIYSGVVQIDHHTLAQYCPSWSYIVRSFLTGVYIQIFSVIIPVGYPRWYLLYCGIFYIAVCGILCDIFYSGVVQLDHTLA